MKLRTQLVIAILLLAVLPLAGIVTYSYLTSLRAVRQTVAEEAGELATEMNDRLAAVEGDIQRRVGRFQQLPLRRLLRQSGGDREELTRRLLDEMGDAAPLVEAFEIRPAPGAPRPPLPPGESGAPFPPAPKSDGSEETAEEIEAIVLRVTDEALQRIESGETANAVQFGQRYGQEVGLAVAEMFLRRFGEGGEPPPEARPPEARPPEALPPELRERLIEADAPQVAQEITIIRDGEDELPPEELARLV
ncbi:MAG: hypothetical protein AAF560_31180, partial [Acidobacteriota bacterium]